MAEEFISLAIIALAAFVSPIIANSIPGKPIPETVFLLVFGLILGPNGLGMAEQTEAIEFISELGMAFLFLLAGFEIEVNKLTGPLGKQALITWLACMAFALGIVYFIPAIPLNTMGGLAIAIAMTTTAYGTLAPIMKERGLEGTRVGDAITAHGVIGEIGPVLAIVLLLSARTTVSSFIVLIVFILISVGIAAQAAMVSRFGRGLAILLRELSDTTSQTTVRATVLLLLILSAVASFMDLDIVLGAFAAGFILKFVMSGTAEGEDESLEKKLDGIGYGFFIPIFFIYSGMGVSVMAVMEQPFILLVFIFSLLAVRATPVFIAVSYGKSTRDMNFYDRLSTAVYCATALPLIVGVTNIAVSAGAMDADFASVLVAAGAASVLIMPILTSIITVVGDLRLAEAAQEIASDPLGAADTVRRHRAVQRLEALRARQLQEIEKISQDEFAFIRGESTITKVNETNWLDTLLEDESIFEPEALAREEALKDERLSTGVIADKLANARNRINESRILNDEDGESLYEVNTDWDTSRQERGVILGMESDRLRESLEKCRDKNRNDTPE